MSSSRKTCPKCAFGVSDDATECPACGVIFARFDPSRASRVPSRETPATRVPPFPPLPSALPPPPPPPPPPVVAPVFRRPGTPPPQFVTGDGVWQYGSELLVMWKEASLPNRCLRCNAPAAIRLRRQLSWHPSWYYLFIFLGILVYIVAALIGRKLARVELPICQEHEERRKRNILIAWGLFVAALALFFLAVVRSDPGVPLLLGLAALLAAPITGIVGGRLVNPKKIDDQYVWLKGVSPDYLRALPAFPFV